MKFSHFQCSLARSKFESALCNDIIFLVCASLRVLGGPRALCFIISAGPVEICALKFRPSLTALEMAEFHLTKKKVNE